MLVAHFTACPAPGESQGNWGRRSKERHVEAFSQASSQPEPGSAMQRHPWHSPPTHPPPTPQLTSSYTFVEDSM